MKHQLAIVSLWFISLAVTFIVVRDDRVLTILGPVYAVCMIGSLITVRAAARRSA